jgi:hypothetical protein
MISESTPNLWIPGRGDDLADEFPVPTQAELTKKWQEYDPNSHIIDAPGVYGIMSVPTDTPEQYVSLDMCEVMRETHLSLRSIMFANEERFEGNIHKYAFGTCLENAVDYTAALRVLMNSNEVKPVADIEKIAEIIEEVADQGAYIFVNTSTLSGCEPGTIDFLKKYIPHGLKGIAFPRNHDGLLPLTKGHVIKNVIDEFSDPNKNILAVQIDDSPHYNIAVREEVGKLPNSKVITIMPEYPTHFEPDNGSILTPTPLAAFQAMRSILKDRLN